MNTPLFFVMQSIFMLLYMLEILLWRRIRKCDPFNIVQKNTNYNNVPMYVLGIVAGAVSWVFIADAPIRFRLTFMLVLIAPIVIAHIRSIILHVSLRKQVTGQQLNGCDTVRIMKMCYGLNMLTILIYSSYVALCMLYFR